MGTETILAADIGSVSVALVEMNGAHDVVRSAWRAHRGRVAGTLRDLLADWPLGSVRTVAATHGTPECFRARHRIDAVTALVTAHRPHARRYPGLLAVGGERFALVRFDEDGTYRSSRGNSSCAAGTGAFLDQQAARLGLSGAAELARLAAGSNGSRPAIASRCSVFAKTDLIHAQQEGYKLAEICDGLCHGLARNLVDALVTGEPPAGPILMAGGVALNAAVVEHVAAVLDRAVEASEQAPIYAAVGAGAWALDRNLERLESAPTVDSLVDERAGERTSYHDPIGEPSCYPDLADHERFTWEPQLTGGPLVEVDRYTPTPGGIPAEAAPHGVRARNDGRRAARRFPGAAPDRLYLGLDIGSTSTKAILMTADGDPTSAFYTRTAGKPLLAVQAILETIDETGAAFAPIAGVGTTGSGRKLAGAVVGADLILDEISAHARAAVELDPATDTIIEIGGQDSKFTTLRGGRVTFSQMNAVCAAGTGSFLEEQASRLGVPLDEYGDRAIGVRAPLTSDRCTVFMERDLNHYLNRGYSAEELLAASLHSVRDNYLQKVARLSAIGRRVCFQGATARNRALVSVFEQRLGTSISVSRYCHVTGALGAALTCRDEFGGVTRFRGISLYRADVPVRSERCSLCPNTCRITVAEVAGETVAYGFLCGRDYATHAYVSANASGFDLTASRRKEERLVARAAPRPAARPALRAEVAVGVPHGLHLSDEHAFWLRVMAELGIRTVTCRRGTEALAAGKRLEGAEFCAPVAVFHGQVAELLDRADAVLVPIHLESPTPDERGRAYCYYTQFTPSVLAAAVGASDRSRVLTPVLWGGHRDPAEEIRDALAPLVEVTAAEVHRAMETARRAQDVSRGRLKRLYERHRPTDAVAVALLGRPYTAVEPWMNKQIPEILGRLGVRCFYQDMLPLTLPHDANRELIESVHWRYAAEMLLAADYVARTHGLYPVLMTSFKCAPDAFCIDAFKRVMDQREKPYLVLQLDEHDSTVGYETRIEAALRSFANHFTEESARTPLQVSGRDRTALPRPAAPPGLIAGIGDAVAQALGGVFSGFSGALGEAFTDARRWLAAVLRGDGGSALEEIRAFEKLVPPLEARIGGRRLLLPCWDTLTSPLLAANLRAHGVDAVCLAETPLAIRRSMRINSGQCIPVSVIAQEAMDYVRETGTDPADVVLWIAKAHWSCGIPLYPQFIKGIFVQEGLADLGVYQGDFTFSDISPVATVDAYFAYQFGGWLRRLACMTRPYERNTGETDALLGSWGAALVRLFEERGDRQEALRRMIADFVAVPVSGSGRPKVGIFGDLYVRDNEVMNQDLLRSIERAGGEAVTTPYGDYVKIIAGAAFGRIRRRGDLAMLARLRLIMAAIEHLERRYQSITEPVFGRPIPWKRPHLARELAPFSMVVEQSGESYDNALKMQHMVGRYPDLALFVQTSPAFCCPSLVTEALAEATERIIGVPVVTVTYDGTEGDKNAAIVPYIRYARRRATKTA